jgi:hypothetical protein
VSAQDATVKRILTEENAERETMNDERSEAFALFIVHHFAFILSV